MTCIILKPSSLKGHIFSNPLIFIIRCILFTAQIFLAGPVLISSSLTPGTLESLSPLDSDFKQFHNYLSLQGFIYQPNLLEIILLYKV